MRMIFKYRIWIISGVVVLLSSLLVKGFLSYLNMIDIIDSIVTVGLLGVAESICLLVGVIDLSIGTTVGLTGIMSIILIRSWAPGPVVLLAVLGIGLLIGLVNVILVVKMRINPFIATMGTLFVGLGIEKVVTRGGMPIYLWSSHSEWFRALGQAKIVGVPMTVLIFIFVSISIGIWVHRGVIGRKLYAVGSNIVASRYAGVNTNRVIASTFLIAGLLSSIAGLLLAARFSAGLPKVGESFLWDALAAAYLGIVISAYSRGSIPATVGGAIIIGTIMNILGLLGAGLGWMQVAKGALLYIVGVVSSPRIKGAQ